MPQVYYVGLLAGESDYDAVGETGEGRAINRHNYSEEEVALAVQKPAVQRLMKLIRFRNDYPAFGGDLSVAESDGELRLSWTKGKWACTLTADLKTHTAEIKYCDGAGVEGIYRV